MLGDPPVLMFDEPVNEMTVTADHLIVIGQGKLLRDEGMTTFVESNTRHWVLVRSAHLD